MALKNTAPAGDRFITRLNLLTRSGVSLLKSLPFGGAVGVVTSGIVLWFLPSLVPAGWSAEAVLSLGMGGGMVLERLVNGLLGWFLEPVRRHLGSRWEAWLQLRKLDGYARRGMLQEKDAAELTEKIVRADVTGKRAKG